MSQLLFQKIQSWTILISVIFLSLSVGSAQAGLRLDTILPVKKPHLKASLNILTFNTVINRYDAYIKGGGQEIGNY